MCPHCREVDPTDTWHRQVLHSKWRHSQIWIRATVPPNQYRMQHVATLDVTPNQYWRRYVVTPKHRYGYGGYVPPNKYWRQHVATLDVAPNQYWRQQVATPKHRYGYGGYVPSKQILKTARGDRYWYGRSPARPLTPPNLSPPPRLGPLSATARNGLSRSAKASLSSTSPVNNEVTCSQKRHRITTSHLETKEKTA